MSAEKLKQMRSGSRLTQAEFAEAMGLPFRTYQDLEAGKSETRPVHLAAAKWALTTLLAEPRPEVAMSPEIADVLFAAVKTLEAEPERQMALTITVRSRVASPDGE